MLELLFGEIHLIFDKPQQSLRHVVVGLLATPRPVAADDGQHLQRREVRLFPQAGLQQHRYDVAVAEVHALQCDGERFIDHKRGIQQIGADEKQDDVGTAQFFFHGRFPFFAGHDLMVVPGLDVVLLAQGTEESV